MRLVVVFYNCDGWRQTEPTAYESAESFLADFEVAAEHAHTKSVSEFAFANVTWETDDFFCLHRTFEGIMDESYYPPSVLTVDEWFEGIE